VRKLATARTDKSHDKERDSSGKCRLILLGLKGRYER